MMELFEIFIIFIESILFSVFITKYFCIVEIRKSIAVSSSLFLISSIVCNLFNTNGIVLGAITLAIAIGTIVYFLKKITFQVIYIPVLYYALIIVTSLLALIIISIVTGISSNQIINNTQYYIYICLLAKFLLCTITGFILYLEVKINFSLTLEKWGILLVKEFILIGCIAIISTGIITNSISLIHLVVILFMLCCVSFLSIFSVYDTNKINEEKLMHEKTLQRLAYQQENVKMIKDLKVDIDAINHRMFYVLEKVKHELEVKNYDKAIGILNDYKQVVIKQDIFVLTNNESFDALFNLKIKEMKMLTDVKCCITISKRDLYDGVHFINGVMSLLNYVSNSEKIDIYISEKVNRVIIKLYFSGFDEIEEDGSYAFIEKAFGFCKSRIVIDLKSEVKSINIVLLNEE